MRSSELIRKVSLTIISVKNTSRVSEVAEFHSDSGVWVGGYLQSLTKRVYLSKLLFIEICDMTLLVKLYRENTFRQGCVGEGVSGIIHALNLLLLIRFKPSVYALRWGNFNKN